MFTVGRIVCRPGISHLSGYFIYESSFNHIKFRGSCFYITHNNTFCFTMLKILRSVHGQPPVLKHYLCLNENISGLRKCFRQESSCKVKIPWDPILPMKLCKCNMSFVFQTVTWNENIAGYLYINTQNRVNHLVINRNCQRYLFFCWW